MFLDRIASDTRLRAAMRRLVSVIAAAGLFAMAGCGGKRLWQRARLRARLPAQGHDLRGRDRHRTWTATSTRRSRSCSNRFPFGDQVRDNLLGQLEQSSGGISFNDDVKPVLGNPLVVGAVDPEALSGNSNTSSSP